MNAALLDSEQMPATMADPPMRKAVEVLMRLSQSPAERDRYENRLEWERDLSCIKKEEREQGVEEGRITEIVGKITVFQRLLKQTPTSTEQLAQMSLDDLRRTAEDLERQLLPGTS